MTGRLLAVLVSVTVSLVAMPGSAGADSFNLDAQLQRAVEAQNWQRAIQIVDRMIKATPQRATQLKAYRTQLQRLLKAGVRAPIPSSSQYPRQAVRQGTAGALGQVPIKRWAGGVAVIDVTFNRRQQFEMIVDSGAGLTVITRPMAEILGLTSAHVVGQIVVETANGKTVMPIAHVEAIEVGGLLASQVPVAIAGPGMTIGLLGQDFLRRYDVSFRGNIIEFHNPAE